MPNDNVNVQLYSHDLDSISVPHQETSGNSEYLTVDKLPKVFGYGKHYFTLSTKNNSPYSIRDGSQVFIEFKDVDGNKIFSDITDIESISGAIVGYVWIKQNPLRLKDPLEISDGICAMTIAYELDDGTQPTYPRSSNARTTFYFEIRKNLPNVSPILFESSSLIQSTFTDTITDLRHQSASISQSFEFDNNDTQYRRNYITISGSNMRTVGGEVKFVEVSYNELRQKTSDFKILSTFPISSSIFDTTGSEALGLSPLSFKQRIPIPPEIRRNGDIHFKLRFLNPASTITQDLNTGIPVEITSSAMEISGSPIIIETHDNHITGSGTFVFGKNVKNGIKMQFFPKGEGQASETDSVEFIPISNGAHGAGLAIRSDGGIGSAGNTNTIKEGIFGNAGVSNSSIVGAKESIISASSESTIVGGDNNKIINSTHTAIVGGEDNTISNASLTADNILGFGNVIIGATQGQITQSIAASGLADTLWWNTIIGGQFHKINVYRTGAGNTLIGGLGNKIESVGSVSGPNYSAVIGGSANKVQHDNSVIVGMTAKTSDATNTVYVPNLDVSGSISVAGTGSFGRLETTVISSSIIYSSGSNIFGDESTDLHEFVGNISASGAIYMSQSIGTDNSVVVLEDGKLVTDEIDSRVWGDTLLENSDTGSLHNVEITGDPGGGYPLTIDITNAQQTALLIQSDHTYPIATMMGADIAGSDPWYYRTMLFSSGITVGSNTYEADTVSMGSNVNSYAQPQNWNLNITSTGKVGLGTVNPQERLTVRGNISSSAIIYAQSMSIGIPEGNQAGHFSGSTAALTVRGNISGSELFLRTDNNPLITLERNSDQNVGILFKNTNGHMVAGVDEDIQNDGANIFGIGYHGDIIDNDGSNHATFVVTGSQVVINNATSASKAAALSVGGNISGSGEIHASSHITSSGNILARSEDARIRVEATTGNHPGYEWLEAGSRKWITYNDPDSSQGGNDNLTWKNASDTELMELDQDGMLYVSSKIVHLDDADTFINFTDDDINIQAGGVNMLDFTQEDAGQDEITFNEGDADIDFRVESLTDTKAIYIDASANAIQLGSSANTHITASGNISASGDLISNQLFLNNHDNNSYIRYHSSFGTHLKSDNNLITLTGNTNVAGHITSSGNISSSGDILASGDLYLPGGEIKIDANNSNNATLSIVSQRLYISSSNDMIISAGTQAQTTTQQGVDISFLADQFVFRSGSGGLSTNFQIHDDKGGVSVLTGNDAVQGLTVEGEISSSEALFVQGTDLDFQVSASTKTLLQIDGDVSSSGDWYGNGTGIKITGSHAETTLLTVTHPESGSLMEVTATADSGSILVSGSILLKDNNLKPSISSSRIYNSGSNLYLGDHAGTTPFSIGPKVLQTYSHNFQDDPSTTEHALPWPDSFENAFQSDESVAFLCTSRTNVRHVLMRGQGWDQNLPNTITWKIKTHSPHGTSAVTEGNWTTKETTVITSPTSADTGATSLLYAIFSGSHAEPGDLLNITFQFGADFASSAEEWYVSSTVEHDYSTLPKLGFSTGSMPTGSAGFGV